MRIERVQFTNLNSLVGTWVIDFTHPAYTANGIFAITGPTGAGKTTVLDAICLGLYGATPRLDRITQSSNEIMSRQTGECSAEVSFSTAAGRFRCTWSQHRARKRCNGALQQPRHELVNADTGDIIASRLSETSNAVGEKTGLTFAQFTRAMLLAQGDFAAFLQASTTERAPILEQITGTEIYSLISRQVHERKRAEDAKLAALEAHIAGLTVLSDEEAAAQKARIEALAREEGTLRTWREALSSAAQWLESLARLEGEQQALTAQWETFQEGDAAFATDAVRLERARKAKTADHAYGQLTALREQAAETQADLTQREAALPLLQAEAAAKRAARDAAAAAFAHASRILNEQEPIIRQARDMDARQARLCEEEAAVQKELAGCEAEKKAADTRIAELEKERAAWRERQEKAEAYLKEHSRDARLVEHIAAINTQCAAYRDADDRQHRAAANRDKAVKKREQAEGAKEKARVACDAAAEVFAREVHAWETQKEQARVLRKNRDMAEWRDDLEALKERGDTLARAQKCAAGCVEKRIKIGTWQQERDQAREREKSLRTLVAAKDAVRMARRGEMESLERERDHLRRIRSLEEERRHLTHGEPCPLCGALEHPYAEGAAPEQDAAEQAFRAAKEALTALDNEIGGLKEEAAKQEQARLHLEARIAEGQGELERETAEKAALLRALNMDEAAAPETAAAVAAEIDAVRALIKEAEAAEKRVAAAQLALEQARQEKDKKEKAFIQANSAFDVAGESEKNLEADLRGKQQDAERALAVLVATVGAWGIETVVRSRLDEMQDALQARHDRWKEQRQLLDNATREHETLQGKINTEAALAEQRARDGERHQSKLAGLVAAREALTAERTQHYGDKDPDTEEKGLKEAVRMAEAAREAAEKESAHVAEHLNATITLRDACIHNLAQQKEKIAQAEKAFADTLQKAGLADEAEYHAASLAQAVFDDLAGKSEALKERKTQLTARREDVQEKLFEARTQNLTTQPLDAVTALKSACDAAHEQTIAMIGALQEKLREDGANRERRREEMDGIEKQRTVCGLWFNLHNLIGSENGGKYQRFAQGLTFELMIGQANRQLRGMTDRYLLTRDKEDPLELNVIDTYQAGEVRSTKNLSGGESFLVSLALALGLSHIAGNNMRVDSLFLDEGFGTLDAEALETALAALAALRESGKLIGVISHVQAMKERIGTQIEVIPRSGGCSRLAGPGVSSGDAS